MGMENIVSYVIVRVLQREQYVQPGDSIYLIGGALDTLGYLYADTIVAAPSSTCTPGYNESILEYWRYYFK